MPRESSTRSQSIDPAHVFEDVIADHAEAERSTMMSNPHPKAPHSRRELAAGQQRFGVVFDIGKFKHDPYNLKVLGF